MTNSVLIELRNVHLTRNRNKILRGISWKVKKGEHWFILGPNGCGKTSMLEIVLGYHWATAGKVFVLGEEYGKTQIPELRRQIGYVSPWVQKHLKPNETVFECVASGLKAAAVFYDDVTPVVLKQVHRAMELMELRSFEKTPFSRLSSGEQLKVLIARALVHVPKLLILDEPFSALDMGSRLKIQNLIEKMGQRHQNMSILMVTHHFDDITPLYTHGIILKRGIVVAKGLKSSVLSTGNLKRAFNVSLKNIHVSH